MHHRVHMHPCPCTGCKDNWFFPRTTSANQTSQLRSPITGKGQSWLGWITWGETVREPATCPLQFPSRAVRKSSTNPPGMPERHKSNNQQKNQPFDRGDDFIFDYSSSRLVTCLQKRLPSWILSFYGRIIEMSRALFQILLLEWIVNHPLSWLWPVALGPYLIQRLLPWHVSEVS